jgi:AP endonuclease-1
MVKKLPVPSSESSLSPVPSNLIDEAESKVTPATSSSDKKRKAETTEVKVTKRTKKTTALEAEDGDVIPGADDLPRPKKRAPRKVKAEVETIEAEIEIELAQKGNCKAKVVKKTTARKKNEAGTAPFVERTTDTPLVLGAHVSAAGG